MILYSVKAKEEQFFFKIPMQQKGSILDLNQDMFVAVFLQLSARDITYFGATCKAALEFTRKDIIWEKLLDRDFDSRSKKPDKVQNVFLSCFYSAKALKITPHKVQNVFLSCFYSAKARKITPQKEYIQLYRERKECILLHRELYKRGMAPRPFPYPIVFIGYYL